MLGWTLNLDGAGSSVAAAPAPTAVYWLHSRHVHVHAPVAGLVAAFLVRWL